MDNIIETKKIVFKSPARENMVAEPIDRSGNEIRDDLMISPDAGDHMHRSAMFH